MRADYLIDAILRLQAKLIAQVATIDGELANLSQIGSRLQRYVARELGPPRHRVALVASAFGVSENTVYAWRKEALRSPAVDPTDRDWVLGYIRTHADARLRRADLDQAFIEMVTESEPSKSDDELAESTIEKIRARLDAALWLLGRADLVSWTRSEDPLIFCHAAEDSRAGIAGAVWLQIFEMSSLTPVTLDELLAAVPFDEADVQRGLEHLVAEERIEPVTGPAGAPAFRTSDIYLPLEDDDRDHSLEIATLDHLRAVVDTIIERFGARSVVTGTGSAMPSELDTPYDARNGMVSWRFDLWNDHPRKEDILALGERFVELGHRLSVETKSIDGPREAERVVYIGMHTRSFDGASDD